MRRHHSNLMIKLDRNKDGFLRMSQECGFSRGNLPGGEDAVKIVERTRTSEYAIMLGDKAASGVERIDFHFERVSMVGKMATEKLRLKGRPDPCGEPHCFLI